MNQNTMSPSSPSQNNLDILMSTSWAFLTLSRLMGKEIDRLKLHDAISERKQSLTQAFEENVTHQKMPSKWRSLAKEIAIDAGIADVEWFSSPDPARLPALTWVNEIGWGIIRNLNAQGQWIVDIGNRAVLLSAEQAIPCMRMVIDKSDANITSKPVFQLFKKIFLSQKKAFIEAGLAGIIINLLALVTSLYSMQVYDRVIPTQGYSTLLVLTFGVCLALIFDLALKFARMHTMENAVTLIDKQLSRAIFGRLLNIRLDQMPTSVGSLSAQLRGYETIRGFFSASTFYLLVDGPFAIFFIGMIALIGTPMAAVIPLVFLFFAIGFGLIIKDRIDEHAVKGTAAANKKTGLLVEAIEGAETIKSGAGGWGSLSKWIDISGEAIHHDMLLKRISDKSGYISAMIQQLSYIGLIAVGAYIAAEGTITMGGLIACSILSGRALSPISQIPSLIVQSAHAKASFTLLEKVYALKIDNDQVDRPITPQILAGQFHLERVRFAYPDAPNALIVQNLQIRGGEKIGVVGPIGAGKSTLLRLLSGMYQANEGMVMLDNLDISQISRQSLAEKIGYLQQDHRLFSGTLRENLLIGIPDPGDDVIKQAALQSGLITAISNHPKGLDLVIAEGGKGLSGGQRQLVAFTRLLLSQPSIWLLDEPTASMDTMTELRCIETLRSSLRPESTLILVTHKMNLMPLVDRIICIANNQIIMDGARDEVLKKLSTPTS
jgi:ATP-binding cassette subfamily C protein LapB